MTCMVALIVTNCTVLARLEAAASRLPPGAALVDGLAMGSGFSLVLLLIGSPREVIGQASIGVGLHLLLGEVARDWHIRFADSQGMLLASLPPGGFLLFSLLLAGHNLVNQRRMNRSRPQAPEKARVPLLNIE